MLIVALQDKANGKYAIWNTVCDEFLGVNLSKEDAILEIMSYKVCNREVALSRVDNPQQFKDIVEKMDV